MEENTISIYGPVVPEEYGNWDGVVTLGQVENKLAAIKDGSTVTVNIHSPGGDVDTGFGIFTLLRRAADERGMTIRTRATGTCASVATIIFLAGDTRIANEFVAPFYHEAWAWMEGTADELRAKADELDAICERAAKLYSDVTKLSFDEAMDMMSNETSVDPEDLVSLGFATSLEIVTRPQQRKLVATFLNKNKSKKPMSKSKSADDLAELKKSQSQLSSTVNNIWEKLKGLTLNAKVVQDENGIEIVFDDLNPEDPITEGDVATIDGAPATGTHIIAGLGQTLTFENGSVSGIEETDPNDADEDDENEEDDAEMSKEQIDQMKADNAAMKKQLEEQEGTIDELKTSMASMNKSIESISTMISSNFEIETIVKPKGSDANLSTGKSGLRMNKRGELVDEKGNRKMYRKDHYEESKSE